MAIGDKLDKKVLFDPQARNALLIQSTQTALMKFMELFAHSFFFVFVFFIYSYSYICLNQKYFSSEQQGSNAKLLHCFTMSLSKKKI